MTSPYGDRLPLPTPAAALNPSNHREADQSTDCTGVGWHSELEKQKLGRLWRTDQIE
jgi:hypothetical protein